MKKVFLVLILIAVSLFIFQRTQKTAEKYVPLAKPTESAKIISHTMQIKSNAFEENKAIPRKYSCQGAGINPELQFVDVPKDAKSLVLIMDDPDAPVGTFVHWVIYNIPPSTIEIKENSFPQGSAKGKNSVGNTDFVAPCPPSGTHRYFFKLYALNGVLNLQNADKEAVEKAMKDKIINSTQLIGLYSKE